MGMSPFRRGVQSETKKQNFPKSKKAFFEKYRLPQGTPTPIVIVSGDYVDPNPPSEQIEIDPTTGKAKEVKNAYFKITKHKRRILKNGKEFYAETICSAGTDPQNPQPCVGCIAIDSGDKSVTRSEQFVFTIVHLHPYHTHPLIGKEGTVVMKKDNGGPVMVDTECTGKKCDFCRVLKGQPAADPKFAFQAKDIGTVLGKRRYIEVGKGHLSNLAAWDNVVRGQCGNCRSMVELVGYACSTCASLNIDAGTDPRTDQELEEAVSRPYPCAKCQRATMHGEVIGCQVCEAKEIQPTQGSLFGVVLWGSREGEGMKSQLVLARFETPEEYNEKVPPALLNGKTVQQIVSEVGKPYDFTDILAPESLQEQVQRLELGGSVTVPNSSPYASTPPNPFASKSFAAPPQTQFAPYPDTQGTVKFVAPVLPNFGKGNN
jgi:hypothetical protein